MRSSRCNCAPTLILRAACQSSPIIAALILSLRWGTGPNGSPRYSRVLRAKRALSAVLAVICHAGAMLIVSVAM